MYIIPLDFGTVAGDGVAAFQARILLSHRDLLLEQFLVETDEVSVQLFGATPACDPRRFSTRISLDRGQLCFAVFENGQLYETLSSTAALDLFERARKFSIARPGASI